MTTSEEFMLARVQLSKNESTEIEFKRSSIFIVIKGNGKVDSSFQNEIFRFKFAREKAQKFKVKTNFQVSNFGTEFEKKNPNHFHSRKIPRNQ
jgi:hypothetical protein